MTRADGRKFNELREVKITTNYIKFAEGSVLIQCGDTMVLCNASVEEKTPPHVKPGHGWVTAEETGEMILTGPKFGPQLFYRVAVAPYALEEVE